jgi:drug/metabolite transporter (DMT)-like permease
VNPVVAVLLGYFVGGEALGTRTMAGTFLVLVSVVVITTAKKNQIENEKLEVKEAE